VNIAAGSGSTPSEPVAPSKPATSAKPPAQSYVTQPKSSPEPQQPDDEDETAPPAVTPRPSAPSQPDDSPVVATTIYRTVTTTLGASPTGSPDSEEGTDDSEDNQDSEDSDDSGDSEESEDSENTEESAGSYSKWSGRPHRKVDPNARRYVVDDWNCECRREPGNSRCYCDSPNMAVSKRTEIEKKALRIHRRTLYKRVDACDWNSAPAMEVSYYTPDAKCAPNAKQNTPESDEFELGWDVSCGVVDGDGEYNIKMMRCDMFGA
jgi:hypothetical protein